MSLRKFLTLSVAGVLVAPFVYAATDTEYKVRDRGPANGWIFYVNPTKGGTWKYLEAAPSDCPGLSKWSNVTYGVAGKTSMAVGSGIANTKKIINQTNHILSAAKLCDELEVNGFNDWFLPSGNELDLMYVNLKSGGVGIEGAVKYEPVGGFVNGFYWSSSEGEFKARAQGFYLGYPAIYDKNNGAGHVRCVRAF
jgi:hypothetical protein